MILVLALPVVAFVGWLIWATVSGRSSVARSVFLFGIVTFVVAGLVAVPLGWSPVPKIVSGAGLLIAIVAWIAGRRARAGRTAST
jgi:hypothetical protein